MTLNVTRGGTIIMAGVRVDAAHVAQDIKDGAALRRLREALPADCGIEVYDWRDEDGVSVSVMGWNEGRPMTLVAEQRPTIADAADKCRERLTPSL